MNLSDYADSVKGFRKPDGWKGMANHAMFGLVTEASEVADLWLKAEYSPRPDTPEFPDREEMIKELGDVLFYVVWLCDLFFLEPSNILEANIQKLEGRYGKEEE